MATLGLTNSEAYLECVRTIKTDYGLSPPTQPWCLWMLLYFHLDIHCMCVSKGPSL